MARITRYELETIKMPINEQEQTVFAKSIGVQIGSGNNNRVTINFLNSDGVLIGTRNQEVNDSIKTISSRAEEILYEFPEKSVVLLALQSHIHKKAYEIVYALKGGAAGTSYPGRHHLTEFETPHLINMLPSLIDATCDVDELSLRVEEFLKDIHFPLFGIELLDDDFQRIFGNGLFIATRLDKLMKYVNKKFSEGERIEYYTKDDLRDL